MRKMITRSILSLGLLVGLFSTQGYAQEVSVSGTVSDQTGEALPGVNISVKGTTRGTSTDVDGAYSLTVPSASDDTLIFSYIGYKTQEIPIDGRETIDVNMELQSVEGEEVVVVGYGTQQKSDLTGSITSVDAEDIANIPTSNLQDALQGKVSGVQITPTSGSPGSQPTVRIRGVGTLNNSNPLYVVDGMLLDDISYLSPNDIESIQVLKDASATAIYGSRGANGVVIVTTKKGASGEPSISLKSYFGVQRAGNRIDMVNARQYATLVNESQQNVGEEPIFSNPDRFGSGTNWQDVIFEDVAPQQNYQLTASGGTDNFTYNVSGNYFKQQGIVKGSDYQRVSLRVNNEYFLSDNVTFGHNIAFTYNDSKDEAGDIVNQALRADPTISPYNDEGDFSNSTVNGGSSNPAATIAYNNNDNFGYRTVGNAYMEVDFLKYFNFRSSFGLDMDRGESKVFTPEFFVSAIQQSERSKLNAETRQTTNWLNENTLNYQRDIADHSFKLLGGITFQKNRFEDLGGSRVNIIGSSPEFWYLNAGATDGQTNFNSSEAWGMISYLFRANYSYKDRYLFTGTYRIDGSSRFAEDNRYGYFPSVALGWRISDEPFMHDVSYLSNLKLRGSWGIIGNDKIDPYGAYATISSNVNAVFGEDQNLQTGATQQALANAALQWEESEQFDIGLEAGFFENRLTAELDWYHRETDRILIRVPIPDYIGVPDSPFSNAASVLNRGFDLSVNWQGSGNDYSYSIGFTGSTVHNEVLALGGGKEEILGGNVGQMGGFTTRTVPGHPIGAFYGWKSEGIFQTEQEVESSPTRGGEQPGDIKIADLNDDGTITDDDKTFLGSPIPDYIVGLNLSGSYKQFDASLSFDGQFGNQVLYARKAIRGFRLLNYEESYLDRWTEADKSNTEPRITESGHNYEVVDRFLESGDFVRLRNVQVGYSLPAEAVSSLHFKKLRIYANAKNLFTITDYVGYNPQIGGGQVTETAIDRGTYPIPSIYTIGVELSF